MLSNFSGPEIAADFYDSTKKEEDLVLFMHYPRGDIR